MKQRIIYLIITLLLVIGILGSGGLFLEEIKTGQGCPKLLGIPMCLVILVCFFVPLVSHLIKRWIGLFYLFTGVAVSIALIASIMQYTGNGECPKTALGTPMCYYSLLLFSSIIILKTYHIKNNR